MTTLTYRDVAARISTVACIIIITSSVYVGMNQYKEETKKTQELVAFDNSMSVIERLIRFTDTLPEGPLKSNLYTVIATEYTSDSDELNQILQEYSRLQMDRITKGPPMQ